MRERRSRADAAEDDSRQRQRHDPWASISESLLRARNEARVPSAQSVHSHRTHDSRPSYRRTGKKPIDAASESGESLISSHAPSLRGSQVAKGEVRNDGGAAEGSRRDGDGPSRRSRDSPLRRWTSSVVKSTALRPHALVLVLSVVVLAKWCIGLGGYSGRGEPPMRGDLEAQRHWIAMTSSYLSTWPKLARPVSPPSSAMSIPPSRWYFHDTAYWGLDYPPLTAYHSMLIGLIARLSESTARFVTLRPAIASATEESLRVWDDSMRALELDGGLQLWMRATVIVGDLLIWLSAIVVFARRSSSGTKGHARHLRNTLVVVASIGLQPSLLLIDSGHFQYNSVMLGLTLWAVICFQRGRDVLGGICFVLALSFKQMALYYAPAVFAYLLGKCFWLGGSAGFALFVNLGFAVVATFLTVLLPFCSSTEVLLQVAHRVFPFARGIFEDKVANFWCTLNVVIKLRSMLSTAGLARLAMALTIIAVLPMMIILVGTGYALGKRRSATSDGSVGRSVSPILSLLPQALFQSAMAFFLFSFQVHEKSILLPLMPLALLLVDRDSSRGAIDWEWAAFLNNVATFSMWPLLRRDRLAVQYCVVLLGWNLVIGYHPLRTPGRFLRVTSCAFYGAAASLHALEAISLPPAHLPDLFVVLNQALSAMVFGLAWLWSNQRLLQDAWGLLGIGHGDHR